MIGRSRAAAEGNQVCISSDDTCPLSIILNWFVLQLCGLQPLAGLTLSALKTFGTEHVLFRMDDSNKTNPSMHDAGMSATYGAASSPPVPW